MYAIRKGDIMENAKLFSLLEVNRIYSLKEKQLSLRNSVITIVNKEIAKAALNGEAFVLIKKDIIASRVYIQLDTFIEDDFTYRDVIWEINDLAKDLYEYKTIFTPDELYIRWGKK